MSFITDIKDKIKAIGPGEFQELCDVLLSKLHPEWNIHELGMKSGTGKTTIGNPDTYFRIENGEKAGKYVFVAYTTQDQSIYNKIKEDIEKCLDESKTGLPRSEIAEIIVCHISDNLKAGDDKKLHDLCGNIPLQIYGIDQLSGFIYNRFPMIARDILHLPLDTNQIYDDAGFVRSYDASDLAAPLNTPFMFREKKCSEILNSLKDNRFVVLSGTPGVGKTRLALEVCRQYAEINEVNLICIKNNGVPLHEDFLRWVEQPGKYIVLIDDANDIEELQFLVTYAADASDQNIRFVLTVRNYAKDMVIKTIRHVSEPVVSEISKLSDEEITEFIEKILDIHEQDYMDQIIRIAEGNPRIAYMAGKIASDNDLSKIYDVSYLMDQYYEKTIDKSIGDDESLCITAGILAVVRAVSLNDLKNLEEIFQSKIINQKEFIQCCRKLVNLEVAEEQYGTINYSDQCFSNYMLYYTFFRRKIIPFSMILDIGFRYFREEIVQATKIILTIFNNDETEEYLKGQIKIVWERYRKEKNQELFEAFSGIYHLFFPEESLLLAKRKIDVIQSKAIPDTIDFDQRMYDYSDPVLNLLNGYENVPECLDNAMELALQFAVKSERNLIKFRHWFNSNFEINENSQFRGFGLQNHAIEFMKEHCLDGIAASKVFLSIGTEWLTSEFHPVSMGRNHSLLTYRIVYQYSDKVTEYRTSLLDMILKVINETSLTDKIHDDVLLLLKNYSQYVRNGLDQKIVESDAPYIEKIINSLNNDLNKSVIVNSLLKGCSIQHYKAPWNLDMSSIFSSEAWKIYSLFSNDYVPSEISYEEFQQQRQKRIESSLKKLNKNNMDSFVIAVENCITVSACNKTVFNSPYSINDGFRILFHAISDDHELSIACLKAIQKYGSEITCRPCDIFNEEINRDYRWFYDFIVNGIYKSAVIRNEWLFIYFDSIPEEKCNQWLLDQLILFLKDDSDRYVKEYSTRDLEFLLKFRKIKKDIFPFASRIILEKREYKETIPSMYFYSLFREGLTEEFTPENLLILYQNDPDVLKSVYIYELQFGHLSDYEGKYLSCFCHHDATWLNTYCGYLFQIRIGSDAAGYERERLNPLWLLDEHEPLFDSIFQYALNTNEREQLLKNREILRRVTGRYSDNPDIAERQRKWYLHLVKQYAFSYQLKYVFYMCCDLDDNFRLEMFQEFLEYNQNFEDFKELSILPNFAFSIGSLVPTYQKRKDFLLRLRNIMQGIRFLEHRNLINEMITSLNREIDSEETRNALYKAKGW